METITNNDFPKINVFGWKEFNEFCKKNGFTDETLDKDVNLKDNYAFISILGTPECTKYYLKEDNVAHWFLKPHSNVLNIEFDDLSEDIEWKGHKFKAMDLNQAADIVRFIENNKGKIFFIHCWAGVSRSQAAAQFIKDVYYKDFKREFWTRNNHVYSLLIKVYQKIHEDGK